MTECNRRFFDNYRRKHERKVQTERSETLLASALHDNVANIARPSTTGECLMRVPYIDRQTAARGSVRDVWMSKGSSVRE